jgi:hypothetical protein
MSEFYPPYLDASPEVFKIERGWNATTNSPTLSYNSIASLPQGTPFYVMVGGTQDLGFGPVLYEVGDVLYTTAEDTWAVQKYYDTDTPLYQLYNAGATLGTALTTITATTITTVKTLFLPALRLSFNPTGLTPISTYGITNNTTYFQATASGTYNFSVTLSIQASIVGNFTIQAVRSDDIAGTVNPLIIGVAGKAITTPASPTDLSISVSVPMTKGQCFDIRLNGTSAAVVGLTAYTINFKR